MRRPAWLHEVAAKGQEARMPHPRHGPGASPAVLCHATSLAHQQLFSSQLLLPFTSSQPKVVEERAMARIARLANFITTYSLPQVPSSHSGQPQSPHPCVAEPQHLLGELGTQSAGGWELGSLSCPCPVRAVS